MGCSQLSLLLQQKKPFRWNLPIFGLQFVFFLTSEPKWAFQNLMFSGNCKFHFGNAVPEMSSFGVPFWIPPPYTFYNTTVTKINETQKLLNEKKNLENSQRNLWGDSDKNLDQQILEKLKKIFWLLGLICAKRFPCTSITVLYRLQKEKWVERNRAILCTYYCTYLCCGFIVLLLQAYFTIDFFLSQGE